MAVVAKWLPRLCIDAHDPPQAQNIIMANRIVRSSLLQYILYYSSFHCLEKLFKFYFCEVSVLIENVGYLKGIKRILASWNRARCHSILFVVPKKGAL